MPKEIILPEEHRVRKVVCGGEHTALVTHDNFLYTFGCGRFGKLGHQNFERLPLSYRKSHATKIESLSMKPGEMTEGKRYMGRVW